MRSRHWLVLASVTFALACGEATSPRTGGERVSPPPSFSYSLAPNNRDTIFVVYCEHGNGYYGCGWNVNRVIVTFLDAAGNAIQGQSFDIADPSKVGTAILVGHSPSDNTLESINVSVEYTCCPPFLPFWQKTAGSARFYYHENGGTKGGYAGNTNPDWAVRVTWRHKAAPPVALVAIDGEPQIYARMTASFTAHSYAGDYVTEVFNVPTTWQVQSYDGSAALQLATQTSAPFGVALANVRGVRAGTGSTIVASANGNSSYLPLTVVDFRSPR